jgi:hypothetical protein
MQVVQGAQRAWRVRKNKYTSTAWPPKLDWLIEIRGIVYTRRVIERNRVFQVFPGYRRNNEALYDWRGRNNGGMSWNRLFVGYNGACTDVVIGPRVEGSGMKRFMEIDLMIESLSL